MQSDRGNSFHGAGTVAATVTACRRSLFEVPAHLVTPITGISRCIKVASGALFPGAADSLKNSQPADLYVPVGNVRKSIQVPLSYVSKHVR